jgi:hypothetical protein
LLLLVAGCSSSPGEQRDAPLPDAPPSDAPPPDARQPDAGRPDAECTWECLPHVDCFSGVVTVAITIWEIPCVRFTGSCPVDKEYHCAKGCFVEGGAPSESWFEISQNPVALCFEGVPKAVGSPCADDSDCLPTPATAHPDPTVTNYYLRCNASTRTCEEAPPPTVEGWLQRCGQAVEKEAGSGNSGFVPDLSCPEHVCEFEARYLQTCVDQGCTRVCDGDHQCPQGAVCQPGAVLQDGVQRGACKPGARDIIGIGLMCY